MTRKAQGAPLRLGEVVSVLVLAAILTSCAPGRAPEGAQPAQRSESAGPKRIVAAIMADLPGLAGVVNTPLPGFDALDDLVQAGLANVDNQSQLRPQLAESVPNVENGLWKVLPDGRMTVEWKLRSSAEWHDGTALTTDDLLFTASIARDRDLPKFRNAAWDNIEAIDASDSQIMTVTWKRPYIYADSLFTRGLSPILPRHLLEKPIQEDKATFLDLPYWGKELVGAGPFRPRDFVYGQRVLLDAFDHYVLGRPKLDQIEIQFIRDSNTLVANILAGSIELGLGRTVSLEQGLQLRDQWQGGRMDVTFIDNWIVLYPQFIDANPPVIDNLQFRRALLHAIDRQQMADTLQAGLSRVAHSFVTPSSTQYRDIEATLPHYELDPRRAADAVEELGYRKGGDGVYQDSMGQRLALEVRTTGDNNIHLGALAALGDYWQRFGVATDQVVIPVQRQLEREYRRTFPGFELLQNPNGVRGVDKFISANAPVLETNYTGSNNARYRNPEFDTLVERYLTTIPNADRLKALQAVVYHIADRLPVMGLFYIGEPIMIGSRIQGVSARTEGSTHGWNAEQWDVRPALLSFVHESAGRIS